MNDNENEELEKNISPDASDWTYEDYEIAPEYNFEQFPTETEDEEEENEEEEEEEEGQGNQQNNKQQDGTNEQKKASNIEKKVDGSFSKNKSNNPLSNKLGKNMAGKGASPKDQLANKAKKAGKELAKKAGKAAKEAAKKAAQAAGKLLLHAVKFLFVPPVLWFTLAVIAILLTIALIILIVTMASGAAGGAEANMDPANGLFGTSLGITGEQFYGGRFIYLDPEKSNQDIKDYYYAFSEDFLDAIDNMQNVDLNVSIDLENTNKELSTIIAKTVSASEESLTLEEYIALVDHFGYTNVELDTIQEGFVDYVIDNQETLLTINDGYSSLETDLNTLYDDLFVAYNVTAPLYYVKDVILEGPEAMIPSQDPKNYVAFIYMPRTDVYLVSSSFSFYFPEENGEVNEIYTKQPYATNVLFEYITVHNSEEVTYFNATADSSWWQEGTAQQLAEVNYIPDEGSPLPKFTSIDESNPIIDKSLYSTLFDDNENASTHNVKKYFTANQIQQEDLDYYEISYLPHNDGTYFYIRLTADGIFQYCEYQAEFVTKTN